ncbi:MAG: DUF3592 domain-containing protein [Rhodocyclaceae bacterium]|jgi:hypothetical protein|nr:DUF3592 domain-containing protein [Rhodocyclaceae bacterium]
MVKGLLLLIKLVQILMLLAGLAAFCFGALHLSQAAWWRFNGEPVQGTVIEEGLKAEKRSSTGSIRTSSYTTVLIYRPVVAFAWPPGSEARHSVGATLAIEGRDAEAFGKGRTVEVRVDPSMPSRAYLPLPASAYFWAVVGLLAGGAALAVVTSLFYLHEGAFGRDLSAGLSLFRRLRAWHVLASGLLLAALLFGVFHFATVLEQPPPAGEKLNASEALLAGLPYAGPGLAAEMLERAIVAGERERIDRYLDAHAESPSRFPIADDPPRLLGAAVIQRDIVTLKRLLALGFRPTDDPLFDPRPLAERMGLPEFSAALRETARKKK